MRSRSCFCIECVRFFVEQPWSMTSSIQPEVYNLSLRSTTMGNMHRKLSKIGRIVPNIWSRTDKHTGTHSAHNNTPLPYRRRSKNGFINGNSSYVARREILPSVLWRCWLSGRKGIRPVKERVVGCWRGCLSGVRCTLAYGPADATATHSLSLASVKSRLVLPFWYRLTRVVPEKGPLNGRVCVCVCVCC